MTIFPRMIHGFAYGSNDYALFWSLIVFPPLVLFVRVYFALLSRCSFRSILLSFSVMLPFPDLISVLAVWCLAFRRNCSWLIVHSFFHNYRLSFFLSLFLWMAYSVMTIFPRMIHGFAYGSIGYAFFWCTCCWVFFAHDEVNVHCSPAKKVFFFHSSQLHKPLLEKSQNPREIRTCSLPVAQHKC